MTDDNARTFDEVDRLLNDPTVPLQPALIWHLLNEASQQPRCGESRPAGDLPSTESIFSCAFEDKAWSSGQYHINGRCGGRSLHDDVP